MHTTDFNGKPLSSAVPAEFFNAYVDAALWSSTYGEDGENNLDDGEHDLSDKAKNKMLLDCADFFNYCEREGINPLPDYDDNLYSDAEKSGHDFWLTRMGHGAGFWDGDYPEPQATLLTEAAHAAGHRDVIVSYDGFLIYCGGEQC